ncbi:scavenger receptor cysteine-rich type 1 protein M130 [Elysia marginata]|uniref:Scavenger receptor cysteine-rich type 1 protein M130 n=1 Tax=Elysia marginata TaxID=1093978 RepID=A0AAV4EW15_9GAST|nr:scavenger receptor cysteine-rich type 1 protein M130 [Elysia marginata]
MVLALSILCVALLTSPCSTQNIHNPPQPASQVGLVLQRNDPQYYVRLFNATDKGQYIHGALELSRDGQAWGYTCAQDVVQDTGNVICKMFGYSKGEVLANGILGRSSNGQFSGRVICSATDATLGDCFGISFGDHCSAEKTAGIICFNDTRAVFDMRLADGEQSPTQISGRLEVRLTPVTSWGTVCDDSFNDRSATAACRFLGYEYGEFSDTGAFGSGEQTFLDEVYCEENQSFLECEHDPWGEHDCLPAEDVGIRCMNSSVRLLSALPNDPAVGTVELYQAEHGGWFEVCDEAWEDSDAQVVCRELGFVDGKALTGNSLGLVSYGSLTALGSVTRVGCLGSEANFSSCPMESTDLCEFTDSIINLAAVICYDKLVSEVNMTDAVRIAPDSNASEKVGYLEVRHLGVWGRICEDRRIFEFPPMADAEVTVACRMAGYAGGKRIRSIQTDSTHHIWLRGMKCNGTENSIDECQLPDWGTPGLLECAAPVRVICYEESLPKVISHSAGFRTGYLGVSFDGQVSSVCADNWTPSAASLACRELGHSTGTIWTHSDGLERIFDTDTVLKGYNCTRSSESFIDCITGNFSVPRHKCVKGVAGFACYEDLKLEPSNGFTGVPQIYKEDYGWSVICVFNFTKREAQVICRQLGYLDGDALPHSSFGYHPESLIHRKLICNGSENDVSQCNLSPPAQYCGYDGDRTEYASVSCFNVSDTSEKYRLSGGYRDNSTATGVVQVWRHNAWGYACDEFFTQDDARVICKELSKSHGVQYQEAVKFSPKESVSGPYWLRRLDCHFASANISDCPNRHYRCIESRAAAVICSTTDRARFLLQRETPFSGRVRVAVNDQLGAICADSWDDNAATVFCRQNVRNAVTGVARRYKKENLPFFLSGVNCFGNEDNLFECQNDGWRNVPAEKTACQKDADEAAATCYTNGMSNFYVLTVIF